MWPVPVNGTWMGRWPGASSPFFQGQNHTPTRTAHTPLALLGGFAFLSVACHPFMCCWGTASPSLPGSRLEFAIKTTCTRFGKTVLEEDSIRGKTAVTPRAGCSQTLGRCRVHCDSLGSFRRAPPHCDRTGRLTGASRRFLRTSAASGWVWETPTWGHQAAWDACGGFPGLQKSCKMPV